MATKALRILIVDAQKMARRVLRDILESLGCAVDEAADGFDAYRLAVERQPDMVLMAIAVPGMDAEEACRKIKGDGSTCAIPVIAVATVRDRGLLEAVFAAGADDWLAKPVSAAELQVCINSILAKQEVRRAEALERELQEKAVYESIFEHAPEGLLVLNVRSEVVYINRTALDMLGYGREEMSHLTLQDFWAEESYQEAVANHMGFFHGGGYKKKYDLLFKTRSGEKRWVAVSVSAHRLRGDYAILALTDVAEERQR